MTEENVAIGVEVPNDGDVGDRHHQKRPRKRRLWIEQSVKLDGDEKGGFADGQPAGPRDAKEHSDSFDQGKQAEQQ